jgi:hypothetical protein
MRCPTENSATPRRSSLLRVAVPPLPAELPPRRGVNARARYDRLPRHHPAVISEVRHRIRGRSAPTPAPARGPKAPGRGIHHSQRPTAGFPFSRSSPASPGLLQPDITVLPTPPPPVHPPRNTAPRCTTASWSGSLFICCEEVESDDGFEHALVLFYRCSIPAAFLGLCSKRCFRPDTPGCGPVGWAL